MNIISLGSNCDMSLMIQNHINNYIENTILYTHLFTWSAIKINYINYFLKNPDLLIDNNFRPIYRLISNSNGYNFSRNKYGYYNLNDFLEDIQINSNVDLVHIDIDFKYEDINFWTHGIQCPIYEFNKDKNKDYINSVKNKKDHLVDKFLNILKNQQPALFCIKSLAGEYSLEDIIELNNLLLKYSSQNYIGIIVEEDENINLNNLAINDKIFVYNLKIENNKKVLIDWRNFDYNYNIVFNNIKKIR